MKKVRKLAFSGKHQPGEVKILSVAETKRVTINVDWRSQISYLQLCMHYNKFSPSPPLTAFVECYYQWEATAAEPVVVQSPPNGRCALVFNLGAPYLSSQGNATPMPVPAAFVSGQFTSNYKLHLLGNILTIGAVLRPSAVHNFFGIRMSQLVNTRASMEILGTDTSSLLEKITSGKSAEDRVTVVDEFLLSKLHHAKARLTIIDEAVDYIDQSKGCTTVDAIALHLRVSRRYLEKKFLEKVGISPKFYARLRRFSTLSNEIAHSQNIDWPRIVTEYGFHDQSHLVKEFIEFNQMNPSQYHLLHRELTRFVK